MSASISVRSCSFWLRSVHIHGHAERSKFWSASKLWVFCYRGCRRREEPQRMVDATYCLVYMYETENVVTREITVVVSVLYRAIESHASRRI